VLRSINEMKRGTRIVLIGAAAMLGPPAHAGTFWSRQRADGVVEFTNKQPAGSHWKVLFKKGPGKASALRGATDIVPARDVSPTRYSRFDRDILDGQAFYGIPESFIRAVIKTESDFDPRVVSSAGAEGLMQLLPGTARLMGVTDIFDPRQNIMGGTRYLQVLTRRFCKTPAATDAGAPLTVCSPDEKVKVIAGYQAGPAAVEKYGGIPPYETTHAYVAMVLRRYDQYRTAAGAALDK
jgi:soluble lytic murein transglycosylase-like protein